jgi:hypothetical protein
MGNYCGDCHYRRDARHGTMPAPSMRCTGTSSSASAPGWATTRGWRWCTASWTRCQPLNKRPSATVRRPSCKAWTSYEPTQGVHHATCQICALCCYWQAACCWPPAPPCRRPASAGQRFRPATLQRQMV